MIATILASASLGVLAFGLAAWRLTGSRPVFANVAFVTMALLVAAGSAHRYGANQWTATIAFLATMVMAGRALGTWARSWKQTELISTAHCLLGATACCIAGMMVAVWPLLGGTN